MTFDLKELQLNKSYEFDLVVEDGNNRFAGKLNLTPEKITLKIMGEDNEQRHCSIGFSDLDKLTCTTLNCTFIINDLKIIRSQSRTLCRHPKFIGYFEYVFDVGYVMFCPSRISNGDRFKWFSIHSETISKWIGNTNIQENIIKSYHKKEPPKELSKLTEFFVALNGVSSIGVTYNWSIHSSSPDFKSGILFPPSLFMTFNSELGVKEIKHQYDKTYNLFSFLTGGELLIDKIDIGYSDYPFDNTGSLYYPTQIVKKRSPHNCIFYPLGKDLRFNSLGLPSMPLDIFSQYFTLSEKDSEYWKKYLRYKRMENVEERFLGFFRILETLCFKKKDYLDSKLLSDLSERIKPYLIKRFKDKKNVTSFISGLARYNSSKYNTEKRIQDFFIQIPTDISKNWKFQKKDIGDICKLRNDITHANDYYVNEFDIESKTKFIEILLIFSLFSKIGIDLMITSKLIDRLNEYHVVIE